MQIVVALLLSLAAASEAADLKQLLDAHQWFRLREATKLQKAPALYRGAVASAFHSRAEAERELRIAIKNAVAGSDEAIDARVLLLGIYMREGHSRRALEQLSAIRRIRPDRKDIENVYWFWKGLAQWPDQKVIRRRKTLVRYRMISGNAAAPLVVNGHKAEWLVDTGANLSLVSESEAKRVGIEIRDTQAAMGDATGRSSGIRLGHARELRIGDVHLRDVGFIVVRDDQQPFVEMEPGTRGAIGLPVLFAAGAIAWDRDGNFELAGPVVEGAPNLAFEDAMPITDIEFEGRNVAVHLDTGGPLALSFGRNSPPTSRGRSKRELDARGWSLGWPLAWTSIRLRRRNFDSELAAELLISGRQRCC